MDYGQLAAWVDGKREKGNTIETIQNWALSNSYLNNNTLDKILDATNPNSIAIRESQAKWSTAEGHICAALLALAGGEIVAMIDAEAAGLAAGKTVASISSKAAKVIEEVDDLATNSGIILNNEVRVALARFFKNAPVLEKLHKIAKKLDDLKFPKAIVNEVIKEVKKLF
jgi:hypothetical protein